jgi:hypothetical protein
MVAVDTLAAAVMKATAAADTGAAVATRAMAAVRMVVGVADTGKPAA